MYCDLKAEYLEVDMIIRCIKGKKKINRINFKQKGNIRDTGNRSCYMNDHYHHCAQNKDEVFQF
jgi:urease beta subunit